MGILSRLFARDTAKSSYVRRWLQHEKDKIDGDTADAFTLFVGLIAAAGHFGQDGPAADAEPATSKEYAGDATIFEIACYTHFRLEEWLTQHQPALGSQAAEAVAFWIAEIFAVAWRKTEEEVGGLIAERLDAYRDLAKSGAADSRRHLADRVLATRGDRPVADAAATDPRAAGDYSFVVGSIDAYETTHLPAVIDAARQYFLSLSPPPADAKKYVNLEEAAGQEKRDYLLAMALLEQKDYLRAVKAFTKVIDNNPDNYDALLRRGQLRQLLKEPLEAIEDLTRATIVNADDARAWLERGKCYHHFLRIADKALADYDKAVGLAPASAVGYFARGVLHDELAFSLERQAGEENDRDKAAKADREFSAALADYDKAITLNPAYDEAYVSRGLALTRKARAGGNADYIAKAIADLEQAMDLNWENGYLYKTVDDLKELLAPSEFSRQPV